MTKVQLLQSVIMIENGELKLYHAQRELEIKNELVPRLLESGSIKIIA